jgi:hypothetical protein
MQNLLLLIMELTIQKMNITRAAHRTPTEKRASNVDWSESKTGIRNTHNPCGGERALARLVRAKDRELLLGRPG